MQIRRTIVIIRPRSSRLISCDPLLCRVRRVDGLIHSYKYAIMRGAVVVSQRTLCRRWRRACPCCCNWVRSLATTSLAMSAITCS